jgi:hypothetical protein
MNNHEVVHLCNSVPQWPSEVRLHTLLSLALEDRKKRSVPCSGNFIPQVIYYVQVLVGSEPVIWTTVGAAIQACYMEDKLTVTMKKKSQSEFHTNNTMIRLCTTQPANQGLILLHSAPLK